MPRDLAPRADDEAWMRATLALGRRGFGLTAPNPCVAALVVKDGVVLGRGVTAPGGRPHAETAALAAAGAAARGATLYVTLEPCSHHGHTPPCTSAIIAAGIRRVVMAAGDPDPRVAGRGVAQLLEAGIAVEAGVCDDAARRDHRGHILRVVEGRPLVTLKLAETLDGYAAAPAGAPRLMITGPLANAWVHVQRAMHDAVMVGAGTARTDDPLLTVRLPGMGQRQPARIVLDARAELAPASRLVESARTAPLVLVAGPDAPADRVEALRARGVDVLESVATQDGLDLAAALRLLGGRGYTRVFCEGGPRLAASLLRAGLVDDYIRLTGPERRAVPGGMAAMDAPTRASIEIAFRLVEDRMLGRDRLRRYERIEPCSPA